MTKYDAQTATWHDNSDYTAEACAVDARHVAMIERMTWDYERPEGCGTPPTIYGYEWWADRRHGDLESCGCVGNDAPDWEVVKRALDHYGEHVLAVADDRSMTHRYLRTYWGVKAVTVLTSSVDRYAWAIVMVTDRWLEHVGVEVEDAEENVRDAEVQAYLDGDVYGVRVFRTPLGVDAVELSDAVGEGLSDHEFMDEVDTWEEISAVWGYYGEKYAKECALSECEGYATDFVSEVKYSASVTIGGARIVGDVSKVTAEALGSELLGALEDVKIEITAREEIA